jgi:hypothetical protein
VARGGVRWTKRRWWGRQREREGEGGRSRGVQGHVRPSAQPCAELPGLPSAGAGEGSAGEG